MTKVLFALVLGIAFVLALSSVPFDQQPTDQTAQDQPTQAPNSTPVAGQVSNRSCLKDSDIDKSVSITCGSGPNKGQTYYRVMQNVVIKNKVRRQSDYASDIPALPASCKPFVLPNDPVDRAIRPSKLC